MKVTTKIDGTFQFTFTAEEWQLGLSILNGLKGNDPEAEVCLYQARLAVIQCGNRPPDNELN